MIRVINYASVNTEPAKLEQVLAYCENLNDENKQRVCIIEDIAKIGRLLGNPPMSTDNFYILYEMPIKLLEAVQQSAQAELNTYEYKMRLTSLL